MNDELNIPIAASIQHAYGLQLMRFESVFYFSLTEHIANLFGLEKTKPRYGCVSGLASYMAIGHQLDLAVFVYEYIKHAAIYAPEAVEAIKKNPQYADLEVVRNNIHTYFKRGRYARKADTITQTKLAEYKMDKPDLLYGLRSDISLLFQITGQTRHLVGCDYFIQHCIFESSREWKSKDFKAFAEFTSSCVNGFSANVDETEYQFQPLRFPERIPEIEFFDYKSPALYARSQLNEATTFRLMLMLYQISYGIILVEALIHPECLAEPAWLCFTTKLLAIKYDESFDNLVSLLTYSNESDKRRLQSVLDNHKLNPNAQKCRDYARGLRNTLHFQEIVVNDSLVSGGTPRDHIVSMYLSNAGVNSMDQFIQYRNCMIEEMKQLQAVIREIIDVDKVYRY